MARTAVLPAKPSGASSAACGLPSCVFVSGCRVAFLRDELWPRTFFAASMAAPDSRMAAALSVSALYPYGLWQPSRKSATRAEYTASMFSRASSSVGTATVPDDAEPSARTRPTGQEPVERSTAARRRVGNMLRYQVQGPTGTLPTPTLWRPATAAAVVLLSGKDSGRRECLTRLVLATYPRTRPIALVHRTP
jgi:hypothetical protein